MLVCAFFVRNCTRDRGCSAHPVFPAPSDFRGGQTKMQTSGDQRREKAKARQLFEIESEILPSSLRTQGPIATEAIGLRGRCYLAFSNNKGCGVWVPAFAGTTVERLLR